MRCSAEPKVDSELQADRAVVYVIQDTMVWPLCAVHLDIIKKEMPKGEYSVTVIKSGREKSN